jgi:hypothetical protein
MIMANKLSDLNEILFSQLSRLQDEKLIGEKLTEEIGRSKASVEVAQQVIANGALILSACRVSDSMSHSLKLPGLLTE